MLSIVIPVLNGQQEVNHTIKSIRETSGSDCEIIAVDDASDIPLSIEDKNTYLIRNKERLGVGPSRHLGVSLAANKYILLIDAHMRFESNWLNNAMHRIIGRETTLHCATCLGLDENHMDIYNHKGAYNGARLAICEKDDDGRLDIFEGKWIEKRENEDDYEISCCMGAGYFITKDYFLKLRGLHSLKKWGTDEPYLSMKVWLSGGNVRMMKTVRIGHKFKKNTPYITDMSNLVYNKIRAIKTLFSDNYIGDKVIDKIPKNISFEKAVKMIDDDKKIIEEYKGYYKSIFVHDIFWLVHKFNIKLEI